MIEFPGAAYDEGASRGYAGSEAEVCSILAGTHGDDGEAGVDGEVGIDDHEASVVERAYAAENAAETPQIRYRIDPEEQLELVEEIEGNGLDVVGFRYSRPIGPTETDVAQAM